MPIWLVELLGRRELNQLFLALSLMTAPVWVAMLVFPSRPWVRRLANPFLVPAVLVGVWGYLVYLMLTVTGTPAIGGVDYRSAQGVARNPFVFLAFWGHIQLLNLFLGTSIFQEAQRRKMAVRLELVLTWVLGPVGLFCFSLRLLVRWK